MNAGFGMIGEHLTAPVHPSKPPVFVGGCGHSGTTLAKELLCAHPAIQRTPQGINLFDLDAGTRQHTIAEWNADCARLRRPRWLAKSASYVRNIEDIFGAFPLAHMVLMIRDGRDVALSLRKRDDLESGVQRWLSDNTAAKPFFADPRLLTVRYEQLVRAPEATMRTVLEFLGEPYDADIFEFWQANRRRYEVPDGLGRSLHRSQDQSDFMTLRHWQVSQPLYDGSGRWRSELHAHEKAYIKRHANQLLLELGYLQDDPW
ncbi:MAG: sulfotransferase [Myxococcales bacterium]|nr:sulfotransferase [Myxococcales bacterium]